MIFAVLSGAVVAQVWNLVDIFGKGNETVGYRYTTGLMGIVSIVLFAVCFFSTKERVYIENKKEEKKHSLFDNNYYCIYAYINMRFRYIWC